MIKLRIHKHVPNIIRIITVDAAAINIINMVS